MKKIGFVGVGVMGASMVLNLMKEDYEVHIYTRTKSKADAVIEAGAIWHETPQELAPNVDVLITMVGYPTDVEQLYLAEDGFLKTLRSGNIVIDMTTSSPNLAKQISEEGKKAGIAVLDAPVSGGDIGAKNGTLTIMVGGEEKDFSEVEPILKAMGQSVILQGAAGSGQHTKMVNQIAIASNMVGITEAIVYAKKAGLDPEKVLASISGGSAGSWSLSNLTPRVLKGDFSPGFFIKHFVKDMRIALDEAKKMNLELPGLVLAESMYQQLEEAGFGDNGTQALIKFYEK
ncbi:NAD(P)-dependent oxidoreductase [Listeria weihenstephanensis]|uniref:NAD(P)-dependent oxidoreductase n=1 Tax=Listeria weihenstephanensis TaxID=1006155 RepID=A0A841Z7V8_9LIST|nr:NAD(P)-dependent oxidoreductase [Listeria weihenstephanensis]MBC1500547.1 NAD(P)-dependent oxidoreductase [Listeria weihenstephanensis]